MTNPLHIVVYNTNRPDLLIGRFGLFSHARQFVDLYNKELPAGNEHRMIAFDTDTWQVVWPKDVR